MENITVVYNTSATGLLVLPENGITELTRYSFICFMVLITLTGVLGNGIVVAVLTKLSDRSSTDYLLLAMALIDLLSATVNTTCYVLRYVTIIWKTLASDTFCRLHLFSIGFTNTCSTMLFAAIAFDRLRITGRIVSTNITSDSKKAKWISVGIVISSAIYSSSFSFTTTLDSSSLFCKRMDDKEIIATVFSSILALIYLFMFVVVVGCYLRIGILLRQNHRRIHDIKLTANNRKSDRNKLAVIKKTETQTTSNDDNMPGTSREIISKCTQRLECRNAMAGNSKTMNISTASVKWANKTEVNILKDMEKAKGAVIINSTARNIDSSQVATHDTICLKKLPSSNAALAHSRAERDREMKNRVTLMMFLITFIYISTWIINWSVSVYGSIMNSRTLPIIFFCRHLYMINSMTNPVLYMIMSSKFRQNAKSLLCKM